MDKGISKTPFAYIDSLRLTFNHIKVWYTSGMGFFTDAYDLFIISAILDVLAQLHDPNFPLNGFTQGLLASAALWTAVIGQLLFGFLGDKIGRKAIYGVEAMLMTVGALLSAISPNIYWLIIFRSIIGLGIGGDYPISATIMGEYANVKDRGKLIALVFANQGLGSLAAVAVGIGTVLAFPLDISWRVMAAIGAIPAATVIYLRRKTPETPRYSMLVKGNIQEAKRAAEFLGGKIEEKKAYSKPLSLSEFLSKYWLTLIGTAVSWFLIDIAFYGTGIYSGTVTQLILGKPSSIANLILEQGLPYMVGFFGYFTAVALMDKLGRKIIQLQGFILLAIIYAVVSSFLIVSGTKVIGLTIPAELGFLIYALSFFFIDFGPNTTTFVLPAESYPTRARTTGHGISAASGKLGAAIATYLFPSLLASIGIKNILIILSILSLVGAIVTIIAVKETKGKSLEEISEEEIIIHQEEQSST
ncbi:MFS transporter [Sulfolobus sp. E5-1-F]|uniref:MFS transporter n=1 Tax=Saccharolobus sp. E5-1-F TaxID=2663019 RepID=UPI0012951300|nr:MFS transporter [Sulfolobus sp. E5-1-F]QGA55220.1 MFS transporter [Sulfolobus sp. E5-1-F]